MARAVQTGLLGGRDDGVLVVVLGQVAGLRVVEVPITFVERERGASKMSKDIVVEAMAQTTRWGVEHRAKQVSHVADKLAGKASEVIKQFRR